MGRLSRICRLLSLLALAACGTAPMRPPAAPPARRAEMRWEGWSAGAFDRAARERKLVLVSVQAGWCHWCHVMNDVTYADPEVVRLLAGRFVAIRVDADARPDLAERYARWGWPATAILSPDAEPVTELRGHQPPRAFARLLADIVEELDRTGAVARRSPPAPEPEPELADLDQARDRVTAQLDAMYDDSLGGWGAPQKYPFAAPVELALFRATIAGDALARRHAVETLDAEAALIDPVWGGMYQYSLENRWDAPHFEKITEIQAGAIHNYAAAYRLTGERRFLERARAVYAYATEWLWDPEGGFRASQDADVGTHGDVPPMTGERFYALGDEARRRAGAPHVDPHVYASLNGMMIRALSELYQATLDADVLAHATAAADRVLRTHRARGGFTHGTGDGRVLHLIDQVEMAQGLLALHQVTGEARYADAAAEAMALAAREMGAEDGGFYAHGPDPDARGIFRERRRPVRENAVAARVLLTLHRIGEDDARREAAVAALRSVSDARVLAVLGRKVGEYLLALEELRAPYAILSVVGPEAPRTRELFAAALRFPYPTRIVELRRPGQSRYPYPGAPAVYLCNATSCSMPIEDPLQLPEAARRFVSR